MSVSLIGDGLYSTALVWTTYTLTNTAAALAMVALAWAVPEALSTLLGGILSDLVDRRLVMIIGDAIRAACVGALAALAFADQLTVPVLVITVGIYAIGKSVFNPAFKSIVPRLVPRDLLLSANSVSQLAQPVSARMIGPVLGGVVVAAKGPGLAFAIDALTFAASIVAISRLPRIAQPKQDNQRRRIQRLWFSAAAGFGYARRVPWLWSLIALDGLLLLLFWGPYQVLLPVVIETWLKADSSAYGVVLAFGGAGAAAGSLLAWGMPEGRRPFLPIVLSWSAGALAPVGYALAGSVATVAATAFMSNLLFTSGNVLFSTLVQGCVPDALLGRVTSLLLMVVSIATPLSYAVTAPMAAGFGESATLLISGVAGPCLGILTLLSIADLRREHTSPLRDVAGGIP